MRRNFLKRMVGLCAWALVATPTSAQQVLEVIELNYRSADEVIPMLRPLLAPGGTLSGMQNKLVVRTTPANLADLRKILGVVDARPKRLLISVRHEDAALRDSRDLEISGTIGSERARVIVPRTAGEAGATVQGSRGDDRVRARAQQTHSDESGRNVQTVQVLEGNAAFISLGESIPIQNRTVVVGPGGAASVDSIEYRDVQTGFYATPRVSGNSVSIQIASTRDTVLDHSTGAARIQRVDSVVSGRLGEWIEIGGVAESAERADSGTISHRSSSSTDRRRTFIKVERLP